MKIKTALLITLSVVFLFSACKKEHMMNCGTLDMHLKGTWELRSTTGGNILSATYPPGNGNLLRLSDTAYALYSSGKLYTKGTYRIHSDGLGHDTIIYDHSNFNKDIVTYTYESKQLKLVPTMPDLAMRVYARNSDTTAIN
jgi:hypothetical protein